jgi:uncharacterized protein YneR
MRSDHDTLPATTIKSGFSLRGPFEMPTERFRVTSKDDDVTFHVKRLDHDAQT